MKFRIKHKGLSRCVALLLTCTFVFGLMASFKAVQAAGSDVTSKINWSNFILQYGDGSKIDIDEEVYFAADCDYLFSVQWAAGSTDSFSEGDYFKFTVPDVFAGITLEMEKSGTIWGEIVVGPASNGSATATATFNDNIEGKMLISGTIMMKANSSSLPDSGSVSWTFEFGSETYTYDGVAYAVNPGTGQVTDNTWKYGEYGGEGGSNFWMITLNMPQDPITGPVKIIDTFGNGYQIVPVDNVGHSSNDAGESDCIYLEEWGIDEGFYAGGNAPYNKHAYFQILTIDWDQIRKDYNGSNDPDVPTGAINDDMGDMSWEWDDDLGGFVYRDVVQGATAKITDTGIEIDLPDGALDGNSIQIIYWFEMTSVRPITQIKNDVQIITDAETNRYVKTVGLGSQAIVNGTNGTILLHKRDSKDTQSFANVEFTLKKSDGSYIETIRTGADGQLLFTLKKTNNSYEGTYILTESPQTTPLGYACGEPVTLTLNAAGIITAVNGLPSTSADATGTTVGDICWVSQDGLIMAIYNKVAAPGSLTVTKVDQADSSIILEDARFYLYYEYEDAVNGNQKYYYANNGGIITWEINKNNATALTTESDGTFTVNDLPYGTYYLEEFEAPANYHASATSTSVVINSDSNAITVTNIHNQVTVTDIQLVGKKNLTDGTLSDNMFNFVVTDVDNHVVSTGSSKADGTIEFSPIKNVPAGTYTYMVSETVGNAVGIIYDTKNCVVTVTVADDDNDGALEISSTDIMKEGVSISEITFDNIYYPVTSLTLTGAKTVIGSGAPAVTDGAFTFQVMDEFNHQVSTGTSKADGSIEFTPITYTSHAAVGEYNYKVSEIAGSAPGIQYDTTVYDVKVEVADDGFGNLVATPIYPDGATGLAFVNKYVTPINFLLNGTKNLTSSGAIVPSGVKFDFQVSDAVSGQLVTLGAVTGQGNIAFNPITYTTSGMYSYKVREIFGNAQGITYDTTIHDVDVTVTDDGSGILTAVATYPNNGNGVVFDNTYAAPTPEPTDTPTPVPTLTATPEPPDAATRAPALTASPEPAGTATPVPTPTVTPEPADTATPVPTPTTTPEPVDTATPVPTQTVPPEPTDTTTPVPTKTATPGPADTATPAPTPTVPSEPTDTPAPVPTHTATPEPADTTSLAPIHNATPEPTDTAMLILTPTVTPTSAPKPTDLPAATALAAKSPKTGVDDKLYVWIVGLGIIISLTGVLNWVNSRKRRG